MPTSAPRPIELLAPARNADIAIEAIRHGADAVYIGADSHGARAAAGNSLDDIARVVRYAHTFSARVYVTVNTIIYDSELRQVETLIRDLYRIGVDALIVQDMAVLQMDIPPIALHASTQCDIRTPDKARFLSDCGFSQLVLPRELTLDETRAIHATVDTPLEAFVHGALCVSYSGDCHAGFATMGRSANRGQCPQICRHSFDLSDADGNRLITGKHLLSLRDLNRSAHLALMLEAGVSSFKIEGRLKDAAYVKNVVATYRRLLDEIIDRNPQLYARSSTGRCSYTFTPDLLNSFNRGFTPYFTDGPVPSAPMASIDSPKWTGRPVAKVISSSPRHIKVKLSAPLANGDGLGYFERSGAFRGFRLNRIDGDTLYPAEPVDVRPGTTLYRNHDRLLAQAMDTDTARRTIDIAMTLRATPRGIALDIATTDGNHASVALDCSFDTARSPQEQTRLDTLSKTGDTPFAVTSVTDNAGNLFIPRSTLASLRRNATDTLLRQIQLTHRFDYRHSPAAGATLPTDTLSYHDNIANSLAARFYRDHGADATPRALETSARIPDDGSLKVMTTRYCLRRELGHCLRTPGGADWPSPLYLTSANIRLRVEFDCRNCRMMLFHDPAPSRKN